MQSPIGVYIHVPFCAGKCPYCDFYSIKGDSSLMEAYTAAVGRTAKQYRQALSRGVDTLYFGGGTPSVLGGERLARLIDAFSPFLNPSAEITVECNPAGDLERLFPQLARAGVNRISLGMQSAVDEERRTLGRRADRSQIKEAIGLCKEAGITNISLDLMLGIPSMTMETLNQSIDFILNVRVPHVSAYMLKIEPGTPFAARRGELQLPDEDAVCDQYLHTVKRLGKAGLKQYEISNFALPGFESKHNLKYWRCEEYLGIGPAAHSYLDGRRFYYPGDLKAFLNGASPVDDGEGGSQEEKIMLGLRLTEGIKQDLLSPSAKKQAYFFIEKGLMCEKNGVFSLTPEGFLLSNSILSQLID